MKSDILISSSYSTVTNALPRLTKPASCDCFCENLQEFESIREFFTLCDDWLVNRFTIRSDVSLTLIWLMAGNTVFVPVVGVVVLIIYALIKAPLRRTIEEGSRLASQKYANLIESLAGLETVKHWRSKQFRSVGREAIAHIANWNIKSRRAGGVENTQACSAKYQHSV
ncbi:hypothetical protein O9993_09025 [Vibrio lentus]|nr:hypothetical protein [Vibrio lentus]